MKWRITVMAVAVGALIALALRLDGTSRPAIIDAFSGGERILVVFGLICLMAIGLVLWGWGIGQIKRMPPPIQRVKRPGERETYAAVSPYDEQVLRETAHLVANRPSKERWN